MSGKRRRPHRASVSAPVDRPEAVPPHLGTEGVLSAMPQPVARPADALGRVEEAARSLDAARSELDAAVVACQVRNGSQISWADVGRVVGLSAEGARYRWGRG